MPLVNYVLIAIEIRSELPLREAWRLTMIEWALVQVGMCILLIISNNPYYAGLNSRFSKPAKKEKVDGRISNYQ